jgi:hypothetical protein
LGDVEGELALGGVGDGSGFGEVEERHGDEIRWFEGVIR